MHPITSRPIRLGASSHSQPGSSRPSPRAAAPRWALIFLLIWITCLPSGVLGQPCRQAFAGDAQVYLEVGDYNRYDTYATAWMWADGQIAYCAEPEFSTPSPGTYDFEPITSHMSNDKWSRIICACLFYGYGGPGFDPSRYWPQSWYDGTAMTDARYAALTHIVISFAYAQGTPNGDLANNGLAGCSQGFSDWCYQSVLGEMGDSYATGDTIGDALYFGPAEQALASWFPDNVMPDAYMAYATSSPGGTQIAVFCPPLGSIELDKSSSSPTLSSGNGCYSLEGAVFGLYRADGTDTGVELTTDASGHAVARNLEPGDYVLREKSAPRGYLPDEQGLPVTVTANQTAHATCVEQPDYDPLGLIVRKVDRETGQSAPLGEASLKGAEFTVCYYDGYFQSVGDLPPAPTRRWVLATDEQGSTGISAGYEDAIYLRSGDPFYTDEAGAPVLPLGTITVQETKAPEGYLVTDGELHLQQVADDKVLSGTIDDEVIGDQVVRGDLELIKAAGDTEARFAGVPFKLTETATGESHVIVTDANGYASTSADVIPHTQGTNANDRLDKQDASVPAPDDTAAQTDEKEPPQLQQADASAGVWFTGRGPDAKPAPDDSLGALPYGSYQLDELPCAANAGYRLVSLPFTVSRAGRTIKLGTIDNHPSERIATELTDESGAHQAAQSANVELIDTVSFENLLPGESYQMSGTLMDKTTGLPLIDSQGRQVTAKLNFTPQISSGRVQLAFALDTSQLGGRELVAYEVLTRDGSEVASHEDLTDEGQTVSIPNLRTTATSSQGIHEYAADERVVLIDRVEYQGLIPGKTYTVTGTLIDKATGQPVVDDDGNEVTASQTITSAAAEGSTEVTFTFPGVTMAGRSAVAFETLADERGAELAVHADLGDLSQTTWSPKLSTTARDSADGDHLLRADADQRITDAVRFENLTSGTEYVLEGVLMDAETGEPYRDAQGREVRASKAFTPAGAAGDRASGEVELEFSLDGTGLEGTRLVVFETLMQGQVTVGSHQDLTDASQTVEFPSLATQAADASDGDQTLSAGRVQLVDHVSYRGLVPGKTYTMTGTLVDKKTGWQIADENGELLSAAREFTPAQTEGSVDVTFAFDSSSAADSELVAFERCSLEGELVAVHADQHADSQTVSVDKLPAAASPAGRLPRTGDSSLAPLAALVALGIAGALLAIFGVAQTRPAGRHSSKRRAQGAPPRCEHGRRV